MTKKIIQVNKNPVYEIGMVATVFGKDTDFNGDLSFKKSLQINASQIEAHEELGMIYYRNLKNNQKAIYHFEKVLSMKPNHPDSDKINSILNLLKENK